MRGNVGKEFCPKEPWLKTSPLRFEHGFESVLWNQLQVPETECSRDQILHQEAVKYISKFHTAKWIADQNYKHSLAPTYDALVNKYREELAKHGSGHVADRLVLSTDGRVGAAGRTARAWCGRFCAQFAVARKRLAVGSEMPAAEFEEKAV